MLFATPLWPSAISVKNVDVHLYDTETTNTKPQYLLKVHLKRAINLCLEMLL